MAKYSKSAGYWGAYMYVTTSLAADRMNVNISSAGMESYKYGFSLGGGIYHSIGYNSGSGDVSYANSSGNSFYSGYGASVEKSYHSKSDYFTRGHSARTILVYSYISNTSGFQNGTASAQYTFTVPPLDSYTVRYDGNGSTGGTVPSSQTKWYGETLTLSSSSPTRTGYAFAGWAASASATSPAYQPGGTYSLPNSNTTLYAVWSPVPYKVRYNANGGTGSMADTDAVYGELVQLPPCSFTRTNHAFAGWATSATGAAAYSDQDIVSNLASTSGAVATLYATWVQTRPRPVLSSLRAIRTDASYAEDDSGEHMLATFAYSTEGVSEGLRLELRIDGVLVSGGISQSGGSYVAKSMGRPISIDGSHTVEVRSVYTSDSDIAASISTVIPSAFFYMDLYHHETAAGQADIHGVAFGGPSTSEGFEVDMEARFLRSLKAGGDDVMRSRKPASYWGLVDPAGSDTNWIRSTKNGFIPYASGGNSSSLGTSGWPWNNTYTKNLYVNGKKIGEPTVLWSGAWFGGTGQGDFTEAISAQPNGALFVLSWYREGVARDNTWSYFFVPKWHVSGNLPVEVDGSWGILFSRVDPTGSNFGKYLYIYDTYMTGYTYNNRDGEYGGVTLSNSKYVFRFVLGV